MSVLCEDNALIARQGYAKMVSKEENCRTYCKFGKIVDFTSDHMHEHEKNEH